MATLHYPIRVPSDMLEALGEFTGHFWSDSLALEPFICEAIRNYMQAPPAAATQPAASAEAGYQWKQLFLPAGTRLRASFRGQSYFAEVDGEEIRHGALAMSPSRFANLRGSGNRNAWKAVWLRFPGSDEWLLADVCRAARKAAIARLLGEPGPVRPPAPVRQPAPRPAASPRPAATATARAKAGAVPAMSEVSAARAMPNPAQDKTGALKGRRHKRRAAKRRARNR